MADEEDDDATISQRRIPPPLPLSSVKASSSVSFAPPPPPHATATHDANPDHDDDEDHDDDVEAGNGIGTTHKRPSLAPLTMGTASSSATYVAAPPPSPSSSSYLMPSPKGGRTISSYLNRAATGLQTTVKRALRWRKRPRGPRDVKPGVRAFHNKLLNASRPALACFLATGISMVYPWSNKVTWFSITLSISGVGRNLGHTVEGIRQQWLGTIVAIPLCFFLKLFAFSKVFTAIGVFLVSVLVAGTGTLSEAAKKLCLIFISWDVLVPVVAPSITIEHLMEDLLKAVFGANVVCIVVMLCPVPHLAVWLCRWRLEELQEVLGRFLEDAVDSFCLQDDSGLHDLEDVIDEAAALAREARALLPDVSFELALLGCGCGRARGRLVYERVVQYLGVLEGQLENCRGMAVALSDMYPNATHSEFVRAMRPPLLALVLESKVVLEGTCHHVCAGLHAWMPGGRWRRRRRQQQQQQQQQREKSKGDGVGGMAVEEGGGKRRPSLGGSDDDESGFQLGTGLQQQQQQQQQRQREWSLGGDEWRRRRPSFGGGEGANGSVAEGANGQQQQQQHRRRGLSKLSDTDHLEEEEEEDGEEDEYGDDDEDYDVPAELFLPPKVALARVLHELLKTRMRVVYGVELKAKARADSTSMTNNASSTISSSSSSSFLTHRRKTRSLSIGSFALTSPTSIVFERSASAAAAAERFQEESARVGYMNLLPRNAFILDLKLFVEAFDVHHALCNSHSMPLLLQQAPTSPSTPSSRAAAAAAAATATAAAAKLPRQRCPSCFSLLTRLYRGICQGPGPGLRAWRQPLKVGLAILLSSIVVLVDDKNLGLQTIWCPITVAQTMSSHPSSAFKSGANRVQGTVLGAVMGMAVTTWAPIHNKALIVLVLTLWVFICAFNRGSPTYGEVAVSAALTAPIVVVGPVVGSSGAVVRISQVILGTVIYVAVDNLIFPTRAKLLLRTEMVDAVHKLLGLCKDGLATFRVGVEIGCGPSFLSDSSSGVSSAAAAVGTAAAVVDASAEGGVGVNGSSSSSSSSSSKAAIKTAATKGGMTSLPVVENAAAGVAGEGTTATTIKTGTGAEGSVGAPAPSASAFAGAAGGLRPPVSLKSTASAFSAASAGSIQGSFSSSSSYASNPSRLPCRNSSSCASSVPTIPPTPTPHHTIHISHTSARLAAAVEAAESRVRQDTVVIRQALVKEALYISLASDEPELWHKPFQREAYSKVHAIQLRMHRYLLMLHRSAASFPKELAEWDQEMLRAYESIILRLQRTVEAVFTEALTRLQLLRRARGGGVERKRKFKMGGSGSAGGVNVFQIRQEFRDIQDTIDGLVTDYFARDPVLTSLNFIVPLNGMIYSTRKMSAECVKFVQAVRELMLREKKIGKGVVSVAAATAAVAVLGAENISCSGDGAERGMGARKKVGGGGKGGGTVNE